MSYLRFAGTILSSVVSKPATRRYPFEKRPTFANARGHIDIEIQKCSMCTLCQKKCPCEAITVKRTERIWEIDRLRCIQCGACVEACPKKCLSMATMYAPAMATKTIESFTQEVPPQPAAPAPAATA